MKHQQTQSGFTLIETLVAITIAAIIVGAGYYVYQQHREADRQTSDSTTIDATFTFHGATTIITAASATAITQPGDTITVGGSYFTVRVSKVQTASKVNGVTAAKGMQLVRIYLDIKNTDSQSDHTITDGDFYYQTPAGKRIDDVANFANLSAANREDDLAQDIGPLQTENSDTLVFQVPTGKLGTLVWFDEDLSNDTLATFAL